MKIEKMNLSHINSIQEIENESFEVPWRYDSFVSDIENSSSINLVCKIDRQIVGYCMGWIVEKEFQLNNICILEDFRKNKYGYLLLIHLLELLEILECEKIFLEVDEANYKAINLYEKVGFVVSYTRRKYYKNKNDALVMFRSIM
tara:strand:- start:1873 stop:2307 length:435 start_codon:yes stop_codon:yes gene_type:complete